MRAIEREIIEALKGNGMSGDRVLSMRDMVEYTERKASYVLWSTVVAVYDKENKTITIDSGGYRSVTTKGRINAILRGFNIPAGVYQKDFKWYIDGEHAGEYRDGIVFNIERPI